MQEADTYARRGASASKNTLHRILGSGTPRRFPHAFCRILPDRLGGDEAYVNVLHADGAGTKSVIAYLHYRETGDSSVFKGIAQDSIVMNVDDLLCVGVRGGVLIASTINRHARRCGEDVLSALIQGNDAYLACLRALGYAIDSAGGETADLGDIVQTVAVDSSVIARMPTAQLITGERLGAGQAIVGLSSTGQATYETVPNSGIGSNGLTSARHDLLCKSYAERYPETYDSTTDVAYLYSGSLKLDDPLPTDTAWRVADALLSPTRTYAPVITSVLRTCFQQIGGMVHCSGGGQTKCLRFGKGLHFIKDRLFPVPPVFQAIAQLGRTSPKEMYQVYNMGHRMEIYCDTSAVDTIIGIASQFNIEARQIGHIVSHSPSHKNALTVQTPSHTFSYEQQR